MPAEFRERPLPDPNERLLRKPRIRKPHEEFVLPADPELVTPPPAEVTPPLTLVAALSEEAERVQELLDLLIEHAEDVAVAVPPELQEALGREVRTRDFLDSLRQPSPRGRRLRDHFEQNLLEGCGANSSWPLLAIPDLMYFRDALLTATSTIEGRLASERLRAGVPQWEQQAERALSPVYRQLHQGSQEYRGRLARALWTLDSDLRGGFIQYLFAPALSAPLSKLREQLLELRQVVRTLRSFLCHAQFLQLLQFQHVRELLQNLLEQMIIQQLSHLLAVVLNQAQERLAAPVLDFLLDGMGGQSSPLDVVEDAVGRQVLQLLGETADWVIRYYTKLAAGLLRKLRDREAMLLEKVDALHQYSTVGRWLAHLEAAERLLDFLLAQTLTPQLVSSQVYTFLERGLGNPTQRLLSRLAEKPDYRHLRDDTGSIPGVTRLV